MFSASLFTLCTPWKGLLASPEDTWRKQDGRRAAQDMLPTAELPVGMLPVPTASEIIACSSFALKTWASCDPWSQSCPTEVPFNLTENNRLFSCWPNIKCHFHANFRAWTQAFVFQRMLQKASAFCTDECSQDLENNPPELTEVDFAPYEITMTVIFVDYKRLQLKQRKMRVEDGFHFKKWNTDSASAKQKACETHPALQKLIFKGSI